VITQEYLTNENGYFLGVKVDTAYLRFVRTEKPLIYKATRSRVEGKEVPVISVDTFQKMPLEIEFFPSGKVKQLVNWKIYRDVFVSSASLQVREGLITPADFAQVLKDFNDEGKIRHLAMEDINYVFHLFGDTFNTAVEYLRLKTVRSPFSGYDYYIQGNLTLEKPPSSVNSIVFHAHNEAGPKEKPLLMEEAKAYQKKMAPEGEPLSEIKAVGLNSEQSFTYNLYQRRMMSVTLSDVVALDRSSRGNIRTFDFWDFERDTEN